MCDLHVTFATEGGAWRRNGARSTLRLPVEAATTSDAAVLRRTTDTGSSDPLPPSASAPSRSPCTAWLPASLPVPDTDEQAERREAWRGPTGVSSNVS